MDKKITRWIGAMSAMTVAVMMIFQSFTNPISLRDEIRELKTVVADLCTNVDNVGFRFEYMETRQQIHPLGTTTGRRMAHGVQSPWASPSF